MSEAVVPPRALWVPFALGRPLGAVDDAEFQKNVMRTAFGLLDTAEEPTIEDYQIEAPDTGLSETWSCPLNLTSESSGSLVERLLAEVARLRPWAIETRRQRGRTLFGISGAEEDDIDESINNWTFHSNIGTGKEKSIMHPQVVSWNNTLWLIGGKYIEEYKDIIAYLDDNDNDNTWKWIEENDVPFSKKATAREKHQVVAYEGPYDAPKNAFRNWWV